MSAASVVVLFELFCPSQVMHIVQPHWKWDITVPLFLIKLFCPSQVMHVVQPHKKWYITVPSHTAQFCNSTFNLEVVQKHNIWHQEFSDTIWDCCGFSIISWQGTEFPEKHGGCIFLSFHDKKLTHKPDIKSFLRHEIVVTFLSFSWQGTGKIILQNCTSFDKIWRWLHYEDKISFLRSTDTRTLTRTEI
jgi:hypothetical protein